MPLGDARATEHDDPRPRAGPERDPDPWGGADALRTAGDRPRAARESAGLHDADALDGSRTRALGNGDGERASRCAPAGGGLHQGSSGRRAAEGAGMSPRWEDDVKLVWEAPPDPATRSKYKEVLAEIKRNPGRWARVREGMSQSGAHSAASGIRRVIKGDEHWKVVARPQEDGTAGVWVIYRTKEQLKADSGG